MSDYIDRILNTYRNAILEVFDPNGEDEFLKRAVARDVYRGDEAPGQWGRGKALLEIYCEGGIPNSVDFWQNTEKWFEVDRLVNDRMAELNEAGQGATFSEAVNGAVICVWPA